MKHLIIRGVHTKATRLSRMLQKMSLFSERVKRGACEGYALFCMTAPNQGSGCHLIVTLAQGFAQDPVFPKLGRWLFL